MDVSCHRGEFSGTRKRGEEAFQKPLTAGVTIALLNKGSVSDRKSPSGGGLGKVEL